MFSNVRILFVLLACNIIKRLQTIIFLDKNNTTINATDDFVHELNCNLQTDVSESIRKQQQLSTLYYCIYFSYFNSQLNSRRVFVLYFC